MRDPYDILGVDRSATQDEIKSAFRRLAMLHHPDKNPGDDGAPVRFKEINAAYQILSDPEKRAAFDRGGDSADDVVQSVTDTDTMVADLFTLLAGLAEVQKTSGAKVDQATVQRGLGAAMRFAGRAWGLFDLIVPDPAPKLDPTPAPAPVKAARQRRRKRA